MHTKLLNLNRTEKDNFQLNPMPEHTWSDYYQKLWTQQVKDNTTERKWEQRAENCVNHHGRIGNNHKNTKTQKISRLRRD